MNPTNTAYLSASGDNKYLFTVCHGNKYSNIVGKLSFELWDKWDCVDDNEKERVGISLVDVDSILHQFLLQSAAAVSATDNCTGDNGFYTLFI